MRVLYFSVSVLLIFLLVSTAFAQEGEEVIKFNGFLIEKDSVRDCYPELRSQYTVSSAISTDYYLVKLQRKSGATDRTLSKSLKPIYPLPERTYLISTTLASPESLESDNIIAAVPYLPRFKIDPTLSLDSSIGVCPIVIHVFPDADLKGVMKSIKEIPNIDIRGQSGHRIGLQCPWEILEKTVRMISEIEGVFFIAKDRGVELFNKQAIPILQSGQIPGSNTVFQQGLYGEGQIIAVCDTGIDADSCYFRDFSGSLPPVNDTTGTAVDLNQRKVIAVDFLYDADDPSDVSDWDDQGHGTLVSGSALGSDISAPTSALHNGMAPLSKLVMQDAGFAVDDCADLPGLGCPVIDLTPVFQQAYLQGARIHSNSWGDRENYFPHNTYTGSCRDVDDFTWNNRDFLVICAAGNDGQAHGAVASPGVAKNALSVGGTFNGSGADGIISFSSRGPASDGRIKPDLVAPAYVTSSYSDLNVTTDNCTVTTAMGTSLSTPLVAGAAGLVREYFLNGFYPDGVREIASAFNPSAALVKAMLINSCVDVSLALSIPAIDQGWGRVALDEALYFQGEDRNLFVFDEFEFTSSDSAHYEARFEILSSSEPLKVTLVWSDYPATLGAEPQLVNDLNLNLIMKDENYRGNNFSYGLSVPGGSYDTLNNVEQVLINSPTAGTFYVRVIPETIAQGPQDFALVITGAFREAETSSAANWHVY